MKIVTWNVNGARAREAQILELVEKERPDVLCLQEIKANPEQLPDTLARSPASPRTTRTGTARAATRA
jgi:exonuclease III